MSTASKITLGLISATCIATIVSVHYGQKAEKAVWFRPETPGSTCTDGEQAMHAGVIRDMENQRLRKERQLDFEMQKALEKEYKKIQTVTDTSQEIDTSR
jgi:protein PET117